MCLSGWVVWSRFIYFFFIYLFSHYYIVLLWFLSHCLAHIDISKLKWILLSQHISVLPFGYCQRGPGISCVAGGAAGGLALWHFPSVMYGVVVAVLVVPQG